MAKQKESVVDKLDTWHKTTQGLTFFAFIEFAIAYAWVSWAIDTGELWQYALAVIFLFGGAMNLVKLIKKVLKKQEAMASKQQRLDEIAAEIIEHNVCPDLAKQATQLVFGDGNINTEIVFIGEAPGKQEDLQGKPFVGASGRFLDEMLATVNLNRSDVYITNIVKYRPPNNRDPLPEEKKAFLGYLQAQLETLSPKLVVTLGRHSMNCFLPDMQISKVHGQPKRVKLQMKDNDQVAELVILPLYHPAAALYNGDMRQTLLDDFANVPLILQKITNESETERK